MRVGGSYVSIFMLNLPMSMTREIRILTTELKLAEIMQWVF